MYLGHGYCITSDKYQYMVGKKRVVKEGKDAGTEIVEYSSYHPTVFAAVSYILRQLQRGDIDLHDEPEEVYEEFRKHLEDVKEMFSKCEHLELGEDSDEERIYQQESSGDVHGCSHQHDGVHDKRTERSEAAVDDGTDSRDRVRGQR